jgi:hypothetical protein
MGKIKLNNGTPVGNDHLCRRCSHGKFTMGYRETDVLVICTYSNPAHSVPFPVHECTEFWDRNRPDYDEMTKLALDFTACRRKPVEGFRAGAAWGNSTADDSDGNKQDEAAQLRPFNPNQE